jgi:hypothetical protein
VFRDFQLTPQYRAKGRRHFILSVGVLQFGVPLGVILVLSDYLDHYGPRLIGFQTPGFPTYLAIRFIVMTLVTGLGGGAAFWWVSEHNISRHK